MKRKSITSSNPMKNDSIFYSKMKVNKRKIHSDYYIIGLKIQFAKNDRFHEDFFFHKFFAKSSTQKNSSVEIS